MAYSLADWPIYSKNSLFVEYAFIEIIKELKGLASRGSAFKRLDYETEFILMHS